MADSLKTRTSKSGSFLSPFDWVFIDDVKALPTPSYQVVFDYLRYWGMWFNWTLRNVFLFDELRGVPQQLCRMKEKLICHQDEVDLCHQVLQHSRRFTLLYCYS